MGPPSLSELTTIISNMELTHLGFEASICWISLTLKINLFFLRINYLKYFLGLIESLEMKWRQQNLIELFRKRGKFKLFSLDIKRLEVPSENNLPDVVRVNDPLIVMCSKSRTNDQFSSYYQNSFFCILIKYIYLMFHCVLCFTNKSFIYIHKNKNETYMRY